MQGGKIIMMLMFSKGRILGGLSKPFLVASRKQGILSALVLYCAMYLYLFWYLLSHSSNLHQGLWFKVAGLDAVCNILFVSIICYLKSITPVFASEGRSCSVTVGCIMLPTQLPCPSKWVVLVLPVLPGDVLGTYSASGFLCFKPVLFAAAFLLLRWFFVLLYSSLRRRSIAKEEWS